MASRAAQETNLCAGFPEAEERIRILCACLMLGVVEEACLRWTAVQNERQLVEGMDREVGSGDSGAWVFGQVDSYYSGVGGVHDVL